MNCPCIRSLSWQMFFRLQPLDFPDIGFLKFFFNPVPDLIPDIPEGLLHFFPSLLLSKMGAANCGFHQKREVL
jgi:hypothetical protein